jgi:hypothetical protein
VADKYTLAPAGCVVCRLSKVPCMDLQSENDDLAYQVSHNYLCRDCIRDMGMTITKWAKDHAGTLGWQVIRDDELEHLIDERNAAIQEAEAANAELREFEALRLSLGKLRLTPDPIVHAAVYSGEAPEPRLEKKVPKQRVQT